MIFKYNIFGYDKDGYNRKGYNKQGYDREGYNESGYDKDGYNREGYNESGYDKDGYNREGYNESGYDKDGYNHEGYNVSGYDKDGYNHEGYNVSGYDKDGYNREGYNESGYDKDGYNHEGYNVSGYDKDGFNRKGFNKEGYNRDGFDCNSFNKDDHHNNDSDKDDTEEFFENNYNESTKDKKHNNETEIKAIKIGLASPEKIREWSHGEVKITETINYRTLKPEKEGLFCEKIFGPTKDWECHCGKYKKIRFKGKVCERCGVEVTSAAVRYERMGHIELAAPVSHIWYFKGTPSRMGLMLDISHRDLENVLYFAKYIVVNPGDTQLEPKQILNEKDYEEVMERYDDDPNLKIGMGAEAIQELLEQIDVDVLCEELKEKLNTTEGFRRERILKRLEVAQAFKDSGNRPEWMIIDVIPVIPPELRPMVQLDGGRFTTSDINELYRRVINRNNRLKKLLELGAPNIIVNNEKRMLQEAVDALIDNGRRGRPVTGPNNRALKSLSDMLKGNQGRFRQSLLGKNVDYSGSSVIVADSSLKIYQCGLPKEMAIELFKPFVMKRLCELRKANNIKSARKMVERASVEVWDALAFVMKDHPVILSRTPSFYRNSILAFEPLLVEDKAIRLNPLVHSSFNTHFKSQHISVHVPLTHEAQSEARILLLASNNLLKPSNSKPLLTPTQDMVFGAYYLTLVKPDEKGNGKAFTSLEEAIMAYEEGDLSLHAPIRIRMAKEIYGRAYSQVVNCTLGKALFNDIIPQDLGFVDRSKPENMFKLEINELVNKNVLDIILERCIKAYSSAKASEILDNIQSLCYKYATQSGITVAVCDATIPEKEKQYLAEAEVINTIEEAFSIEANYREGLNTFEYFISAHKLHNKLTRKSINISDSFYLTRRLIDVAHSVIINHEDCHCNDGIEVYDIKDGNNIIEPLWERLTGRYLLESFRNDVTGEIICDTDTMIDDELARKIAVIVNTRPDEADRKVKIRSPITCESDNGVCIKCYGLNLATAEPVTVGEPVGIIAAQSMGEQGPKLTKRIFLTTPDIAADLPRIEELFECRRPKTLALLSEIDGKVSFEEIKKSSYIVVTDENAVDPNNAVKKYLIPFDARLRPEIQEGAYVKKGQHLTEGAVSPHDLLAVLGVDAARSYLLNEIQTVYRLQDIDFNDKHIEIIIRQMMRKVKIEAPGSTTLLQGSSIEKRDLIRANTEAKARCEAEGIPFTPAAASTMLLGITKTALTTESFISSASFQETTNVLTDAAIKGKVDPLLGLKESIIIGKPIPAGTGFSD